MDDNLANALAIVSRDRHAMAKALVTFIFREVVEDIHAEGKITDAEMKELNKKSLNRAALFTDHIMINPDMKNAFLLEAVPCMEWDPPELTDDLVALKEQFEEIAGELMVERLKAKKKK